MRFDENFYVSLTLSGNSKESDVFDLGGAGIAEGPGVFVVTVTTKVTAATKVELQTSDDNTNYAAVGACSFAANDEVGTQKVIDVPPGCGRYLKLVATGTSMAGKIDCGLTIAAQSAKGIETFTAN
jgi:hypothetical protein